MARKLNHAERKEQIVEAAFDVIYYYGFENTSLRNIAKQAGLSLGSVQHFFPRQRDIYAFAMDIIFQRFEERMQKVVQVDQDAYENAVRMVKQIVQVHTDVERMENNIWVKFTLMATMNPEYHELQENYRKVNLRFAEDILRMLYEHGYITNHISIKDKAHSLIIFVTGLVFESVIYADLYNDQFVEEKIKDYLGNLCK